MARIAYEGVSKIYDDGTWAVEDFDLEIDDGEHSLLLDLTDWTRTVA